MECVRLLYNSSLEIPSARSWAALVRAIRTVRPVHHVQNHTCRVTLFQPARRAAVLDQPSSLRPHWSYISLGGALFARWFPFKYLMTTLRWHDSYLMAVLAAAHVLVHLQQVTQRRLNKFNFISIKIYKSKCCNSKNKKINSSEGATIKNKQG